MNKPVNIEKVLGACITIVVIIIIGLLVTNSKNKVDQSAGARNASITDVVKTEVDPTANIDPAVLKQAFALHAEDDTVTVVDKNGIQRLVPVPKKVFLISGCDSNGVSQGDTYSSNDGINWSNLNINIPAMTYGCNDKVVYFKGKIWLFDGLNQILSFNGSSWNQESAPTYSPRGNFGLTVFNNKIYVIGGTLNSGGELNEVWSFDGVTWVQLSNIPWGTRYQPNVVTYQNKIWVIGGQHYNQSGMYALDEVWTYDSISWTQHSNTSSLINLGSEVNVFDDGTGSKMYFTGGLSPLSGQMTNEVWSFDGVNLIQKTNASWPVRYNFASYVINGKLFITSGSTDQPVWNTLLNDIWSTSNGNTWQLKLNNSVWTPRYSPSTVKVPITFGQKPDLVSWDIQWKDDLSGSVLYSQIGISKSKNNPVQFMITIKNNGTSDAILPSNTVFRLYKNSVTTANIVGEFNTGTTPYTILMGGSMDFNFNSNMNASALAQLGAHTFYLVADKTNKVNELDETNNTLGPVSFTMIP